MAGLPDTIPAFFGQLSATPLSTTGNGWEVQARAGDVADSFALLANIPRWNTITFSKLLNDKGAGSVVINLDDPVFGSVLGTGDPGSFLLNEEAIWQVYQDGLLRFEFLGETVVETEVDASEQRSATISGPDPIATLGWGRCMPPGFPNIVFKTDAIQDQFDETDNNGNPTLDTAIWNLINPASAVAINPVGTATLTGTGGPTKFGGGPYDITSSVLSANITPIPNNSMSGNTLNGSQLTQMFVQSTANPNNYALIGLSSTTFYAQLGDAGHGGVQTKVLGAYDPTNDAFWMITEVAGTFYFWTSSDGGTWALGWQANHSWDATSINVFFTAQYTGTGQQAQITSVNANVTNSTVNGQIFTAVPFGSVFLNLLQQCQARGTITFVSSGQLSAATDSFGNPWTDTQSTQIEYGTDLYSLLQSFTATVDADYIMQPGFKLQVGLPVAAGSVGIGTDKSQQIIFHEGDQQTSKTRTRARDQITNLIGAVNADGAVVVTQDNPSIAQWQQREGWVQTAQAVDQVSQGIVAEAALAQSKDEILQITLSVLADQPGSVVFVDYDVGDWIGLELEGFSSTTSTTSALRVVGIAVSIDQDGLATVELTLNTYREYLQEQLLYLVNKYGGQFINANGTSPLGTGGKNPTGQPFPILTPALGGLSNVAIA